MNIELEQKKKYVVPEMELVEMKSSTTLLDGSCTDPDKCEDYCDTHPDACYYFPIN